MEPSLEKLLKAFVHSEKAITILTGAGISAESGIPTFRGPEGYWTIGSQEYRPQEMATHRMFLNNPNEVWKWYLYRLSVCARAEPNPGHLAVAGMERLLGGRFHLITQNVDNLHIRAGNTPERTFQIHGNIFLMRCAAECVETLTPVPSVFESWTRERTLTQEDAALLRCPACGGPARPHVLWFDEVYNEPFYRLTSTLNVARNTDLLIVAGTSGTTNLPNKVAWEVSRRHTAVIVDINIDVNPFAALASRQGGFAVKDASGLVLPEILSLFEAA
ncbi:NAD-dependent deacetylase [Desulfococcus sp.]|uniref:SIR2 family NAD-dependent protein deacylase n=1 Tax=Desulfococcus sp. TaxID=2025834 RepID=UPI0035944F89